jgi:hypothetical protein
MRPERYHTRAGACASEGLDSGGTAHRPGGARRPAPAPRRVGACGPVVVYPCAAARLPRQTPARNQRVRLRAGLGPAGGGPTGGVSASSQAAGEALGPLESRHCPAGSTRNSESGAENSESGSEPDSDQRRERGGSVKPPLRTRAPLGRCPGGRLRASWAGPAVDEGRRGGKARAGRGAPCGAVRRAAGPRGPHLGIQSPSRGGCPGLGGSSPAGSRIKLAPAGRGILSTGTARLPARA